MSAAPPPHYTAFRLAVLALVVAVLGLAVWWVADPPVLASVLHLLGIG